MDLMTTLRDIAEMAKRYGLMVSDLKGEPPFSCHCWGMEHTYGSAHAWWCPCSLSYQRRESDRV